MLAELEIYDRHIALIGNWGHQNLWDELILLWNIYILLNKLSNKLDYFDISIKPTLYIYSDKVNWLKSFHKYFLFEEKNINFQYLQELPHGFKSFIKYIFSGAIREIKNWPKIKTYILGGGEIFTPETPFSYQYRTISLLPFFIWRILWRFWGQKPRLIVMGGIQQPKRFFDKVCFNLVCKSADAFYLRDKESVQLIKSIFPHKKVSLFIDSSYFVAESILLQYDKITKKEKQIAIFNTTPLSSNLPIIIEKIKEYNTMWYDLYFLPAYFTSHSAQDDMSVYIHIKQKIWDIELKLLDRRDWNNFINIWKNADFVYASRLHIYLLARFMGLKIQSFKYQKKLQKMENMLDDIGL